MLETLTVVNYLIAAWAQLIRLRKGSFFSIFWMNVIAGFAIIFHAWLLYRWIDGAMGQNLTFVNLFSLVSWVIAFFYFAFISRKSFYLLGIIIFSIAAFSIIVDRSFLGFSISNMSHKPNEVLHILLATASFSVFIIAGLQALILAIQEYNLRKKTHLGLIQHLPPVETTEIFLFRLIATGFVCLSLLLITSLMTYAGLATTFFWQKIALAFLAWLVFALLLIGRYGLGWRGRKAIYATLTGLGLLTVLYYGSELFLS